MRRLPLLLAASAAAVLSVPAFAQQPYSTPAPPRSDADSLADQMRALATNPQDLEALIRAGELALRLGDPTAASRFFARAERIDARNARIKAGLGSLLVSAERPAEALRRFNEAEGLGGRVPDFAADRGLAYDLIGEQERAQRDYRLALKTGPSDETTRRYALSLGIGGKREEALTLLDPLLRKSDRAAWRVRAFILAMGGDQAGAARIASTMMPAGMAQGLQPFFERLPSLSKVDRAFAVHFGEIRPTPERLIDARQVPQLPALGPDPDARKEVAALKVKPREEKPAKPKRGRRDRADIAFQSAGPPGPPPLPPPPAYVEKVDAYRPPDSYRPPVPAGGNYFVQQLPARQSGAAVTAAAKPVPPTARPPIEMAANVPARRVPNVPAPQAVLKTEPARTTFTAAAVATPAPVVSKPAPEIVKTPPALARTEVAALPPKPVPKPEVAVVAPVPVAPTPAALPPEASVVVPAAAVPAPVAAPSPIVPVTPVAQPPVEQPPVTPPAQAVAATVTAPAPAPGFSTEPVTPTAPAAAPPVATAAVAPVRSEDSILSSIIAGIGVPASELGVNAPVKPKPEPVQEPAVTKPEPAPPVETKPVAPPKKPVETKPAPEEKKAADKKLAETKKPEAKTAADGKKPVDSKKLAEDKKAAEKTGDKKATDKKSTDAKKFADAKDGKDSKADTKKGADKKAADAKKLADEKKKKEPPKEAKQPARIWVQVSGGANAKDLPKAWDKLRGGSDAFKGKQAYATPLKATNRLLTGPFATQAEAQAFVNTLTKKGLSGFVFTSDAGQKIDKLPPK